MSIESQLSNSQAQVAIAANKLKAARLKQALNFTNKNLTSSKKRKSGWTIPGPAERDLSTYDRRAAMAQARQLVEETPIGGIVLNAHLDFCVGEELFLSMRTTDREFNAEVERRWMAAKDTLDIRGLRRWGRLVRMWQARNRVDGDVGIVLVDGGDRMGGGRSSFLQTIEADRIWKDNTANDVGITFDSSLRAKKYYIGPHQTVLLPDDKKPKPVDARNFVFYPYFPEERAERMRGVSAFTNLINLLKDLEETEEGMTQKIKNAAFLGLLFRQLQATTEGSLLDNLSESELEHELEEIADEKPKYVKMEPGLNIHAEDGETVEVLESNSPSSEYMTFIKSRLRMIGLQFGLPLEFMMLDPTSCNYAGLMMIGQAMKRRLRPIQADLRFVASRVFNWWLSREVKYNGLTVPKSISGSYWNHRWIIPTGGLIDPKKETDAWATEIEHRLSTRQRAIEEMGDGFDFEDTVDEIAAEETYMDDMNVSYQVGDPGASIANSPDEESTPDE